MPNCPLEGECPSFSERFQGLGCQFYANRSGMEWCNHYSLPIRELKQQPVKIGEEIAVTVTDIHESGAGVGHTDDGFVIFVDGVLPEARSLVRITSVKANHARADEIERLELIDEEEPIQPEETYERKPKKPSRPNLGSREDFWGS
tara:strand:+ start:1540 stop:1977 length:438 start_codon:yes stop_codon:yes gene_type:complete